MRCNESLVGMATLAMHNQQVAANVTNNMIPTLEIKSSAKFQAPNAPPPKENTIEVCIFSLMYLYRISHVDLLKVKKYCIFITLEF